MLKIINSYVFTLIETLLLYWMVNSLLNYKFTKCKKNTFIIWAIFIDYLFAEIYTNLSTKVTPILFILISLIIIEFFYKDNIFIKAFFILLCNYILLISDIVSGNIFSLIYKIHIDKFIFFISDSSILFSLLSKFIAIILVYLYILFFKKINLYIPIKNWILIDIIIAVSIIVINFNMNINDILQNQNFNYSFNILFISLCLLAITTLTIYLFGELCFFYEKKYEISNLNFKNEALKKQLEYQNITSNNLKKIRHDINNNLANISQLLKDNHINESLEYIHAITETLDTTKSVINSGNNYLDAIINYEIAICKKNQINFQLKIDSIPQLNISPTDLSSVISNLLNNAIEANLNLEKCARYISLKIFCYKNYLSIIVENPYKNKLIKDGLILKTTKIDNGYHGYGLKLIRSSVEKYNGVFKYNYKNNIFTSVIMLPLNTNN